MHEQILKQVGLSDSEAIVYEVLLSVGKAGMGDLLKKISLKRGNAYNVVYALIKKGLLVEREERGRKVFEVENPERLRELFGHQKETFARTERDLDDLLPVLKSTYNLALNKPGVRFFEGLEGVKAVLWDSLAAKTEIYSYADIEAIVNNIDEINRAYVARREKLGIKKRGILLDTPFARQYLKDYYKEITETKLIKVETAPFTSIMQIYDGKVSYITLEKDKMIGVIIEDRAIYEMHKTIFNYLWQITPELKS